MGDKPIEPGEPTIVVAAKDIGWIVSRLKEAVLAFIDIENYEAAEQLLLIAEEQFSESQLCWLTKEQDPRFAKAVLKRIRLTVNLIAHLEDELEKLGYVADGDRLGKEAP